MAHRREGALTRAQPPGWITPADPGPWPSARHLFHRPLRPVDVFRRASGAEQTGAGGRGWGRQRIAEVNSRGNDVYLYGGVGRGHCGLAVCSGPGISAGDGRRRVGVGVVSSLRDVVGDVWWRVGADGAYVGEVEGRQVASPAAGSSPGDTVPRPASTKHARSCPAQLRSHHKGNTILGALFPSGTSRRTSDT